VYLRSETLNFTFIPNFIPPKLANVLTECCSRLPWPASQDTRRSNLLFSDPGLVYRVQYRRQEHRRDCRPWSDFPGLEELKQLVEAETSTDYNCCSVMRYPPGIGIKQHRDREMVPGTTIAGISLGASRIFRLHPPTFDSTECIDTDVSSGSLYVMAPPTNRWWTHEIVAELPSTTPSTNCPSDQSEPSIRFSLTFRNAPDTTLSLSTTLAPAPPDLPLCAGTTKSGPSGIRADIEVAIWNQESPDVVATDTNRQ